MRRLRLVCSLLSLALVTAACSSNDDPPVEGPTHKTTAAPNTKSGGPTPQPASCAAIAAVPNSGVSNTTTAAVDFDADGTPDTFRVYELTNQWHVRAEIGGAGVFETIIGPATGTTIKAVGGADVNNDATEEAWINEDDGGGATSTYGFFVFRSCGLQRAQLGGHAAEFVVGASLTHADGLLCDATPADIRAFSTASTDGSAYTGTTKTYSLDLSGTLPVLVLTTTSPKSESDPPGGPSFSAMSAFDCQGLTD